MATKSRLPIAQVAGLFRRNVGSAKILTLHDGMLATSFEDVKGMTAQSCEAAHRAAHRSIPPRFTCNIFLIEINGKLTLIDAGCGQTAPDGGLAPAALERLGIDPQEIDVILMTHMHRDHAGGLTSPDGRAFFPNAELVLHESELAFWRDPATLARLSESQRYDYRVAATAFAAYEGRIRTVKQGQVESGFLVVHAPGHTPGHVAWLLDSNSEQLLIWGDVIHFPAFQFAHPQVTVIYDFDSEAAKVSRHHILDMVAKDRIPVAGIHLDFPSFGYVSNNGAGGFNYNSLFWTSDLAS